MREREMMAGVAVARGAAVVEVAVAAAFVEPAPEFVCAVAVDVAGTGVATLAPEVDTGSDAFVESVAEAPAASATTMPAVVAAEAVAIAILVERNLDFIACGSLPCERDYRVRARPWDEVRELLEPD